MAKVTEYSRITKMKDNDVLLVDGPDGTRTILQTDASKQMGGEVIMVNETAGDSTKVVINTTDEDIELATMADLEPVEEDVSELKTQIAASDDAIKGITRNFLLNKNINTSGEIINEAGKCVTEKIPFTGALTDNIRYYFGEASSSYRIAFYNADDALIKSFQGSSANIFRAIKLSDQNVKTLPSYVRFSFKSNYVPYMIKADLSNLYWCANVDKDLINEKLTVGLVALGVNSAYSNQFGADTLSYLETGLGTSHLCVQKSVGIRENGSVYGTSASTQVTEFIDIGDSDYVAAFMLNNSAFMYVLKFYDANKEIISGSSRVAGHTTIEVPENSKYMRMSISDANSPHADIDDEYIGNIMTLFLISSTTQNAVNYALIEAVSV